MTRKLSWSYLKEVLKQLRKLILPPSYFTYVIFTWITYDVRLFTQIVIYWKIVYNFKIIEWNHLKLWIHITKVKNIVLVLWLPKQQISFQTSLFLKQHLFISGWNWLSRFLLTFVQSLHCVRKRRFLTNRLKSYYYGNIKTC